MTLNDPVIAMLDNFHEQIFQMIGRYRESRAASSPEVRVTEMENGIMVSKPLKKIEHISEAKRTKEPQVWKLTPQGPLLESKAASVPGINKLKAIQDFINSNGRI